MRKSIYSRSCDHYTSQARHQLKALQAGSPVVMEMHIPGLMCQVKPNSARPADEIGDHRMGFEYFAMCLNVCMSVWFLLGVQSDQKVKKYQLTVEATSRDTFSFFVFHVCYSLLQGIKYFMLLSVVVTVHFQSQVFTKTWLKRPIFLRFLSSPWRTSNVSTRLCSLHPPAACSLYVMKVTVTLWGSWGGRRGWADSQAPSWKELLRTSMKYHLQKAFY